MKNDVKLFAMIAGALCSVCAPKELGVTVVEDSVNEMLFPDKGTWRIGSADAWNKVLLPMKRENPTPCNVHKERLHWQLANPEAGH